MIERRGESRRFLAGFGAAVALAACTLTSRPAAAHGGALSSYDVQWLPDGTPHVWSGYGLFINSRERSWNLLCDDFLGLGRMPGADVHPIPVLLPSGTVVTGSQLGFRAYRSYCLADVEPGAWESTDIMALALANAAKEELVALIRSAEDGSHRVELSADLGKTSRPAADLPKWFMPQRLIVREGAPTRIYILGRHEEGRLMLLVSRDGGDSWTTLDPPVPADFAYVTFVALDAPRPGRFLLSRDDDSVGTTLWSWIEGADAAELLFSIPDLQAVAGFAMNEDGSAQYLATRAKAGGSVVSGSLYVSTDAGASFSLISSAGPRYSCLSYHDDALYACADQTDVQFAPFALGRSTDGGFTWNAVMRFQDELIAPPCQAGLCRATVEALKVATNPRPPPSPMPSGSAGQQQQRAAPKVVNAESTGCGIARAPHGASALGVLLLAALTGVFRRRVGDFRSGMMGKEIHHEIE